MLLREVLAARAHIAPRGYKQQSFQPAADMLNANREFRLQLDGKSVRDRYERMQRAFDAADKRDAMGSGVGGEVTEEQELLSQMREAREEIKTQRAKTQTEIKKREDRKLAAGAKLVKHATKSGAIVIRSDDDGTVSEKSDDEGKSIKKRKVVNHGKLFERKVDRFGELMKASEDAQISLDCERLEWDRERLKLEMKEREQDREERVREREADRHEREKERETRERMELEKFKMMMETFRSM